MLKNVTKKEIYILESAEENMKVTNHHQQVSASACSSYMLLLVFIPFILVSAVFFFITPNTSWVSLKAGFSSYDVLDSNISSNSSKNSTEEENERYTDLNTSVVVVNDSQKQTALSEDSSTFNQSSPTQTLEVHQPQIVIDQEGLLSSNNESDFSRNKTRARRTYSKLAKLEANLAKTRAAILEAGRSKIQIADPDNTPQGPMYHNSRAFHRSYLEMEKEFKVYVYEEGEPPLFHNGPCKSIYSSEGNFIYLMELDKQIRTQDPEKAHVYFLPFSITMMVHYVYVTDSRDRKPIEKTVSGYVNALATKYPYWNRSLGADHFMLSCHDWGPVISAYVPYMFKNSIRALCNANTSEGFRPSKDVTIPEINLVTGDIKGWIGGPSPSQRPILAFFAGGLHGPIRPILLEHWKNKDNDIQVYEKLPGKIKYHDIMKKSKFCICPSGYEVASPRIVEAIYTGCVPVLISDHYVPPFSDVLKWKSFSVEVPVSKIPELKNILMNISQHRYIRMQRRVVKIRKHFEVNSPPKRFDVFHMILHSIWLRRLNVRIHEIV